MADKTITCADCGQPFTFSQGEQEFFQQRGMSEPKRCKECRQAKKAERGGGGGNRRGGGGGGGGRGGSYDRW
jgi:Probable zinc-ribbon domain